MGFLLTDRTKQTSHTGLDVNMDTCWHGLLCNIALGKSYMSSAFLEIIFMCAFIVSHGL